MNLTEHVRELIVKDILDGKYGPGDKIPAEREMATLTSTSRVTVRRAYEQLEASGIIERHAGVKGTCVTTDFTGNDSEIESVALITSLRDPFVQDFIEAIQDTCNENDILIVLGTSRESIAEQMDMVIRLTAKGVKNMIVWGFDKRIDMKLFERVRVLGVNIVFFDRILPWAFADYVGLDNRQAIKSLIDVAIEQGKTQFVFTDVDGLNIDSNQERQKAFLHYSKTLSLVSFGLQMKWPLEEHEKDNHAAWNEFVQLHKLGRQTAVICMNDSVALQLKKWGAEHVSFFSVDGRKDALEQGVVSVRQPIQEMAAKSIELLQKQQREGAKWNPGIYRFEGSLVVP